MKSFTNQKIIANFSYDYSDLSEFNMKKRCLLTSLLIIPSIYGLLPNLLIQKMSDLNQKELKIYNIIIDLENFKNECMYQDDFEGIDVSIYNIPFPVVFTEDWFITEFDNNEALKNSVFIFNKIPLFLLQACFYLRNFNLNLKLINLSIKHQELVERLTDFLICFDQMNDIKNINDSTQTLFSSLKLLINPEELDRISLSPSHVNMFLNLVEIYCIEKGKEFNWNSLDNVTDFKKFILDILDKLSK